MKKFFPILVAGIMVWSPVAAESLQIVGAKTLCTPLKENAAALQTALSLTLAVQDQGGSEEAIKQVFMGKADAACVVRPLSDQEANAMEQRVVAYDYLIAVVKKGLAVDNIKRDQIKTAFASDAKSWKELDPAFPDLPLEPITTRKITATEKNIQKLFLDGAEFRASTLEVDTMSSAPKLLQNRQELGAISIMSQAFLRGFESSLKILSIDGVFPSRDNVLSGKYPYGRPVSLVFKKGSARTADLDKLAEYLKNPSQDFFKGEFMPAP